MAYVPIKPPSYASKGKKNCTVPSLDGGVVIGADSQNIEDNQCSDIKNMWFRDNTLKTRFGQRILYPDSFLPQGSLHSMSEKDFYGNCIFHIGNCIYKWDGENTPECIYIAAEDTNSVCFEINATVYFFTSSQLLSVDSEFIVSVCEPYIPTIYRYTKSNLSEYTTYEQMNLLTDKVSVIFNSVEGGYADYTLPYEADTTKEITAERDGIAISPSNVVVLSSTVVRVSGGLAGENDLKITFTLSPNLGYSSRSDKIYGCTIASCFGGTTVNGSRVFMSGNPDYPGYYFRSDLLNPTYFRELDFDIIGSGNNIVTGFKKQYGDMVVFTERTVSRIIYSFDDTGADFTVKELNSNIGCDMPGSIQLIDNRLVFANSKAGVYIIDSTENFDELNIKPISGNINGFNKSKGLLSENKNDLFSARSIDFDRKYWLFIGEKVYLWDYGQSPYYDSGNYKKAQSRLSWFLFDNMKNSAMFEKDGNLYTLLENSGLKLVMCDGQCQTDFGEKINCYVITKSYDFGSAFSKKKLCELCFTQMSNENSSVCISVISGTEELFSKKINSGFSKNSGYTVETDGIYDRIKLKVTKFYADSISVKMENTDGSFSLSNLLMAYIFTDK